MLKKFKSKHPDFFLFGLIFILTIFGIIVLTSASSDLGKIKFDDSYFYLKHQIIYGLLLGLLGFLVTYFIPYPYWRKTALPLLLGNMALLVLVFTKFGLSSGGASRWLKFGSVSFQPAELLKITFILFLASWLTNSKFSRNKDWKSYWPIAAATITVVGLLIAQPATSIVVILVSAGLAIYFLNGADLKHIALIGIIGAIGLALLIFITPYRFQRVMSFFKPSDNLGKSYHLNQALIAIGSGKLTGTGFGESTAKVTYLPAVIDDSIFAVVAQELGFIGAGGLIVLFMLLTLRLFWRSLRTKDPFGRLILVGFGTIIAMQSITNIGAISGVLPLTGVPLPFVSYGGTALAVFLTMSGMALNVSKYNP